METQTHFFLFLLLVVSLTAVMGLSVIYFKEKFEEAMNRYLPFSVSFGAGVLLAIAVEEFLPATFREGSEWSPLLIFLGVAFVIFAEKFITPKIKFWNNSECHHKEGSPLFHQVSFSPQAACTSIGCIAICSFFDGMNINAGFQLGTGVGWLMGFGFLFLCALQGVVAASIARMSALTDRFAKWSVFIVGLFILLGGLFGMILQGVFGFEKFVLPLASGILLYVCFVHLLSVALRRKSNFYVFLAGGGTFLLLCHLMH